MTISIPICQVFPELWIPSSLSKIFCAFSSSTWALYLNTVTTTKLTSHITLNHADPKYQDEASSGNLPFPNIVGIVVLDAQNYA